MGYRKYGHAGTLDPDATGLLVILLGKATRLSDFITGHSKSYDFDLHTGIVTDTDDMTGEILQRGPVVEIDHDSLEGVLAGFTGAISQRPPAYSAVRVDGRRAYRLAREGSPPELPHREVTAGDWRIRGIRDTVISLSVTVSSGTYVRSLARDIGAALGTGGTASGIRRTSIGAISVTEASTRYDDPEALIGMVSAIREFPVMLLDAEQQRLVSHGRPLASELPGQVAMVDGKGMLLAVGEGDGHSVRPMCVLMGGEGS